LAKPRAAPCCASADKRISRQSEQPCVDHPAGIEAFGPDDFGIALHGREGRATGFPTLTPFSETPRQIQLLLRVQYIAQGSANPK
jgi:hypothetical protein